MAQRPSLPPAMRGRAELNLSRAKAAEHLHERVNLGKALRTNLQSLRSRAELLAYDVEFDKWHDYNKELLNTMFTNNALEEEYKDVRFAIIPSLDTDQELSQKYVQVADCCITKLQSILERLEFYPEVVENHDQGTLQSVLSPGPAFEVYPGSGDNRMEKPTSSASVTQPPQKRAELVILKPTFMGMSIDINELLRRLWSWWQRRSEGSK